MDLFAYGETLDGKFVGIPRGFEISAGRVARWDWINKYGSNFLITTATDPEDVWEGGGVYNFSLTSDIDTLSSSDAGDIGHLIRVQGLENTENPYFSFGYAVLNGQNKVKLYRTPALQEEITFYRVHRMTNISNSTDYGGPGQLVGTLYCYVDTAIVGGVPTDTTKIRALIDNGYGETRMLIFTIPPKHVGFLLRSESGIQFTGVPSSGPDYARIVFAARPFQKTFLASKPAALMFPGTSIYVDEPCNPVVLPALLDLKLQVEEVSSPLGIWGSFCMVWAHEELFDPEYLAKIAQPGYRPED